MSDKKAKEKKRPYYEVTKSYEELADIVNEHLPDFIPEIDKKSDILYEAMKYSLEAGGKRLRPVLLLASCEFCGGDIYRAIPYAVAIEYIHTYSLIHDDLPAMDNDDLRRGKPTSHKQFGEAIAILAGDALLNAAFEILNRDMYVYFDDFSMLKTRIRAANVIAAAGGGRGMIAGQVADIESQNKICSVEMIDYIHINKTSSLIEASLKAGAFLADGDEQVMKDLISYGSCLGLAFQIQDDVLDVEGCEKNLGKSIGSDECENKCTYATMYGLDKCKKNINDLNEKARKIMGKYYDNAEFFTSLVDRLERRAK